MRMYTSLHVPDHVQLCHLLLPGEERPLDKELPKDAATGPHVNGRAVALLSQQEFRGAVPQRDDTVGVQSAMGMGGKGGVRGRVE